MNKQELKQFTYDLLNAWQLRDAEKIASMYSKDVVAYMDDKVAYYNDIMNRLEFSKKFFKEVTNDVKDIIIDDAKVVARIEQTCVGRNNKVDTYKIIAIYHIKNYKLLEMWSSFYPNVDYLKNE